MFLTTPRLLVVDNDHNLRKEIKQQLREKYIVTGAENGLEAVDLLREDHGFDLLLVDMVMPLMDGLEMIREVRNLASYESTPVIMMSRNVELPERRRALEAGALGVLHKPIDPFELEFKLRNISDLSSKLRSLTRNVHVDTQTGLPDAIAAAENIKNEYDRCRRGSLALAIIKFNIDRFSENRAIAAIQTDRIEGLVASYLLSAFQRPNDRLGYLGSGQFILSTAEHTLNPLRIYLESLRKSLAELGVPHSSNDPFNHVTISIGAGLGLPHRGEIDLPEFINLADACLAKAMDKRNSVFCQNLH